MEQAMEQRMANRIPWQSSDPAAILRVGERSALTLHRYNRDAAQLVRVGLARNPFAAVLLNRLLLRRHLIAEDLTDTLIDVCLKALADAESQGGVEDALDLAPLCAALIFLGQREQAARALTLCRQACPDIEKGIEFSHKLRRLVCVEADSAFLFQIEMLNLFYRTFPLMWNEQILYHYGLELPTGGHCPAALASLIHQAAQDLSYRYLNNLFVLLIDFDDLHQVQGGYYADGQQIVEALDKYGVFGWESGTGEEEITDPQHMVLAVLYDDGTVFRVEASGLLSQALPDEYDEVRDMLLSGEYSGS